MAFENIGTQCYKDTGVGSGSIVQSTKCVGPVRCVPPCRPQVRGTCKACPSVRSTSAWDL